MIWGAVSRNNAFPIHVCPAASFSGQEGDPSIYHLSVARQAPTALVHRMGYRSAGRMYRYIGSPFP